MKQTLRLSGYRSMSPNKQAESRSKLVEAARGLPNGDLHDLDVLIASFEGDHGMDSQTLREKLSSGEVDETDAVCAWLMLLERRDHLVRVQARSGPT